MSLLGTHGRTGDVDGQTVPVGRGQLNDGLDVLGPDPSSKGTSTMHRFRFALPAMAAAMIMISLAVPAHGQDVPTSEIVQVTRVDMPGAVAWTMRAELGGATLPVAFCVCRASGGIEAEIQFGPLPRDGRPIQLAIRRPDGTIERFGPVFAAGSRGGPHTSRIVRPDDVERFIDAAFRTGSLIADGHESLLNTAAETENRAARETILACLRR